MIDYDEYLKKTTLRIPFVSFFKMVFYKIKTQRRIDIADLWDTLLFHLWIEFNIQWWWHR